MQNKKTIVISGNASLEKENRKWVEFWSKKDYDILDWSRPIDKNDFKLEYPKVHKEFYQALNKTGMLFVANEDKDNIKGYVGVGVFAEIAFVVGLNLTDNRNIKVVLYQEPSQESEFYYDIKLWLDLGWIEIFSE